MDIGLLSQYLVNGLMLGMMYALVAVGFTLFFGVLDIINFSHGDSLMVGTFIGLAAYIVLTEIGIISPLLQVPIVLAAAVVGLAVLGAMVAKYLILPLRSAPPLNTLLITLMLGTVLREAVRLFYPDGSNPKPFPALLPTQSYEFGQFTLRVDNVIMFLAGVVVIIAVHLLINRTKLGLAIRAVAQDEETAKIMGINFNLIVLVTFALGSALAAFAGISERPLLQRDQFQRRAPAWSDRLQCRDYRRAWQYLRCHPRRFSVRSIADHRRRRPAVRQCL